MGRQHFISKTAQIERVMRRFGEAAWTPKFGLVNFSTKLLEVAGEGQDERGQDGRGGDQPFVTVGEVSSSS